MNKIYNVRWTEKATIAVMNMELNPPSKKYKINAKYVFKRAKWVLANGPQFEGEYIDDPHFEFHGHYVVKLEGVVILYLIHEDFSEIEIAASFHAASKYTSEKFFNVLPD